MINPIIYGKKSDIDSLPSLINTLNGKIILTGGIFDFMNPHHIDLFDFASSKGDILIVAVKNNSKHTPFKERLEILEAFEKIDYLFSYTDINDIKKIEQLFDLIISNNEFAFTSDKISFSVKILSFST